MESCSLEPGVVLESHLALEVCSAEYGASLELRSAEPGLRLKGRPARLTPGGFLAEPGPTLKDRLAEPGDALKGDLAKLGVLLKMIPSNEARPSKVALSIFLGVPYSEVGCWSFQAGHHLVATYLPQRVRARSK